MKKLTSDARMNPQDEQNLERLIHRTLRDLPNRRAPGTLEQRVLAEIERRGALSWWRQGFAHWPVPARVTFLILSGGFAKLAIMAAVWAFAGFDSLQFQQAFATPYAWMDAGLAVVRAFGDFASVTVRSIPPLWIYGGLAVIGALYVTLFGLGAAAYRTLYASR
jgi:hypothetical protein